jgi:uncharacterized protein (TIGR03437 family)
LKNPAKFSRPLAAIILIMTLGAGEAHATKYSSFTQSQSLDPGYAQAMVTDSGGNAYIAVNLPPPYFAKIAPDGTLVYKTQLNNGGPNTWIAVAPSGELWVSGGNLIKLDSLGGIIATIPPPVGLFTGPLACDRHGNVYGVSIGEGGLYVFKLDSSGKLIASHNVNAETIPKAIAVDPSGAAYVTGQTVATNFPTTPGAFQPKLPSSFPVSSGHGFVLKLSNDLQKVVYSTYLASTIEDDATSITVDRAGNAYVAGFATANGYPPPFVPFPLKYIGWPEADTTTQAYVLKLNPSGSSLIYSAGICPGSVRSIALANDGRVHAEALVQSTNYMGEALFTLNAAGTHIDRVQFLNLHRPQDPIDQMAIALGSDGVIRLLGTSTSARFPEIATGNLPPTPVLLDFPPDAPSANVTVRVTPAQNVVTPFTVLTFNVVVKNRGPGPAESVLVGLIDANRGGGGTCSSGDHVICYAGVALIPKIEAGASVSIQLQARPDSGERVGVYPLSGEPNMADNFAAYPAVPIVPGNQAQIFADEPGLTYFRSDVPVNCETQSTCSTSYTASPAVTVTVPTPQWRQGSWWRFNSWVDGNRENPRTFDGTNGISLFKAKMNMPPDRAVGTRPASLDFVALPGQQPKSRTILLTSTVHFSTLAVGQPTASWLSLKVSPYTADDGSTVVTGTANTAGLKPGYYTTTFNAVVSASGQPSSTVPISASLRIMDKPATISANGIRNAVSLQSGPFAVGEIVTIQGTGLGPARMQGGETPAGGELPTVLGGTRVLFGNVVAPLLSVQSNAITAIVGTMGMGQDFKIELGGTVAVTKTIRDIAPYAPALSTRDPSGHGQLAALNADGTINSPEHPARRGSVVMLYATGILDGCAPDMFGSPVLNQPPVLPEIDIGGPAADVLYAGSMPGVICAVQQINVVIPEDSAVGPAVPVHLGMPGPVWYFAQNDLTLAVE